jgi:hypothetical protein
MSLVGVSLKVHKTNRNEIAELLAVADRDLERRRLRAFTTIGASILPTTQRCKSRQPRLRPAAIRQSAQTITTG